MNNFTFYLNINLLRSIEGQKAVKMSTYKCGALFVFGKLKKKKKINVTYSIQIYNKKRGICALPASDIKQNVKRNEFAVKQVIHV